MEATQMISDSILESDEEENEENENKRGRPLAKLCILKNAHIPETEFPLFLGNNVLGREPNTCTLSLQAPSVSKQHATICISVYKRRGRPSEVDVEALVWDLGSMNGTRKGRLKLTPNVRYALSEGDGLVVADIPCQYVSCAADAVSTQGDTRTPVSRNSVVNARMPDASGEKGGNTSTGSKKCVNGGTKARAALPVREDTRRTPVRGGCLSFEQTPTQPQGSLVPESDLDSDGERGDRRRKALVSDSDSHKLSPTCSTFLSPANKIVPESEDESPITPSSSSKNRPHRHVSFSAEETAVDVGRQQLKKKKTAAIMYDSEDEEEMGEERAALGGRTSEGSGQHVSEKQEGNVSLTGEDELPEPTPSVFKDAIPAFNMDSDTDVEGEEEGVASAGPVTLNTNQQADQQPNTAQFHMDSDTDVDDDDALDKVPKSVPSSTDQTKPPHDVSVIQPEGITMDSDTDVDDDDAAVSDGAAKAKAASLQSTPTADSASSTQPKDFHLDSDTDVDEEEEEEHGANNTCPKTDETPSRLDIKPTGPEPAPAAPHSMHLDSDTDDEAVPAPASSEPSVASAVTESRTTADTETGLGILSDSDTDVEAESPLVIPVAVSTLSDGTDTKLEAFQSDTDADTDADESSVPPAGHGVNPADIKVSSGTDVDDKEVEDQIPNLCRENTPGLLTPLLQNCSTPVQMTEGEVEDMQTQAFVSPSSGAFRLPPALRPMGLSPCSDSQEDEDFVVAETQSFVLQDNPPKEHTMDHTQAFGLESSVDDRSKQSSRSFQLGLSDSSHLQDQAQALAAESTQAFVSEAGGANLEQTQAYADRNSLENEATQAYGEDQEADKCLVKEGQVDLALEATQAYISEPHSFSEDETDEDERKHVATFETQQFPTSSTLAMAQTQPMSAFEEEEESLDEENPISSVLQVKPSPHNEKEEREEHEDAAQPQKAHLNDALSVAATQPMCISDDEESDDEDLIAGPRKRKAKPLQLEDTQTQELTNSELSHVEIQPMHMGVAETQPMAASGNEESDDEDSIPGPLKRKVKQLRIEDEQTQTSTNSELSAVASQPRDTGEDGESDDEDSIPGPRKRRAKALQLEETQPLSGSEVSAVETQPMVVGENRESDDEDSIPIPPKRRAKPLQIQEEETQPLSPVETQPMEIKTSVRPQRGKERQSEVGTSGTTVKGKRGTRLRDEEEQEECSEPPRRQTRGKNKALPTTRGRRGRSRPDEQESEEEEEVEPAKQARGKKSTRQQKDNKEEEEKLARNKQAENNNLIKEQEKQREERDKLERKEKEEQERLQAENAERTRLEQERAEKERIEGERREKEEKKRAERAQKEKEEQLEKEKKEKEEKERLEREKAEREEKERLEREEKERLEKERKEKEEKERLEREKAEKEEKERLEKEEKERLEKERKEKEEKERLELEKEKQEKEAKEKHVKEQQENKEEENKPKTPTRSRRATRRTTAALCTGEREQDSTTASDDVPARRTRSRSNSSNSVSSERSASSVSTQGSRGRGRGRGAKRTSEPPQTAIARSSNGRTAAAGPTEQDVSPQGVLSRSSSTNSLNSEISSCNLSSQRGGRGGRGGRQRGRGRKTEAEPDSIPSIQSQNDQNLASKPTARGRKSRKAEESASEVPHEGEKEQTDSQQASTTRGRRQANANTPEPAADKEDSSNQACASEESPLSKKNIRGRGQKAVKSETVEAPVAPAVSDRDEAKETRKGRKRELEANTEESSGSRVSKGKEKSQTKEAAEEEAKDDIPVQAKRKGRASTAQAKKDANDSPTEVGEREEREKMGETVERRGRGRTSVVQKKKKEEQEESGSSVDQDPHVDASKHQTPTSSASRKRQAPADSSPLAKTPRSSSASPATSIRLRAASQSYKVLFTGVVDEEGERVLARLGGYMAKGVADMNCLVTDKVRRTVKFLCAVAKGVPIVTTQWLDKSGIAGSFLPPNLFVVKDPEQEKKFNFCLQDSLCTASSQPLLQGYEIHVTKSVKPEPVHMKDIISCSGATFLPKMPSTHKPQTLVISCEDDWPLCGPALAASLPVVTAEFILTGILQQKVDLQTHTLSAPANTLQLAGGKGRSRKKT
ncbi:mediator of DNA damage checkpoint protein 1 [Plectropomus leopardus]|uniref:mediator of DNA damage checkpoint protein 1 n=1 Tax=Plectropomus leopardus TaxID=160734 RepID=UPI001C4C89D4|nr:mediator of DNA damage checkpoint protein 1 [Plectropomus leopardus]